MGSEQLPASLTASSHAWDSRLWAFLTALCHSWPSPMSPAVKKYAKNTPLPPPPPCYFSRKVGYKHTDCLLMLALAGLSSWAGFGEIASCASALISLWLPAPSRQESSPKHLCPACTSSRRRGCSPRCAGGIFLGEFKVRQHLWVHCSHQLSSVQCMQPARSSWSCWEMCICMYIYLKKKC